MTIIQFQEQGIFIDLIERDDLESTLEKRINEGVQMLNSNDPKAMAKWLGYFPGTYDAMFWRGPLASRLKHLKTRLEKLRLKK